MPVSMRLWCLILGMLCFLHGAHASTQPRVVRMPLRADVVMPLFWHQASNAKGTVLLIPGGVGGFGGVRDGSPLMNNVIPHSNQHFVANGYNVVILGVPSDGLMDGGRRVIPPNERLSGRHASDIRAAVEYIKAQLPGPIWLAGYSMGTVSASLAALSIKDPAIVGVVLISMLSNPGYVMGVYNDVSLQRLNLSELRLPVLVYHHEKDACDKCRPAEVRKVFDRLVNAPIRKLVMTNGGTGATGDPCRNQHWHGFPGMEKEAVDEIAAWMDKPAS
jgi:predicted alpha/beta-hydrolase family hydrolase